MISVRRAGTQECAIAMLAALKEIHASCSADGTASKRNRRTDHGATSRLIETSSVASVPF